MIVLIASINANGQDVKVVAAFDTSRIYIGDQIKFKIIIDQPTDLPLSIPAFKDSLIQNIEILSGPSIDTTAKQGGKIIIEHNYLITSFDSGRYEMPPVYAEMNNSGGVKRFYSDYAFLEVMIPDIAPPDSAQIFDIIAPYKAPVSAGEILPWLLIAALAAMLVYFALMIYKKYKKKEIVEEVVKLSEPAHVIAFRELEKLQNEKLWQQGEVKLYYTRLTEILRQYLENRFGVNSLELTTDETLTMLLHSGFKKDKDFEQLKSILENADMVKFAKYNPMAFENEARFNESWRFVDNTKHVPDEAVGAENDNHQEGGAK